MKTKIRKKIGQNEQAILNKALKLIRTFKVFKQHKKGKEVYFNNLLINHLRQSDLPIKNKNIHRAEFVGETFRPECFLKGTGNIPLCAIECKKLTERSAKSRWKAGLSQALLYSHFYKSVVLVFYDYTKDGKYYHSLSDKRSAEARFISKLRDDYRIYVVVLLSEK